MKEDLIIVWIISSFLFETTQPRRKRYWNIFNYL